MTAQALPATMTYDAALEAVVADEMARDDSVCMFSTLVPPGLAQFGPRARTTPISEAGITGIAVGLAATGKRPVVYWRNVTFSFNALDQVINQAAKLQYMLGGQFSLPIVFRAPCGGGEGMAAQHSQSPYSIFAQIAGLKVVVPSSPADAAGLLRAAIRDNNPVVCCEPARLASVAGEVPAGHVIPIGEAEVKRPGHRRHRRRHRVDGRARPSRRPTSWPRRGRRSRSSIRGRSPPSTRRRSATPSGARDAWWSPTRRRRTAR